MTTASLQFLAFSAIVIAAYNVSSAGQWRRAVLFLANLAFLASFWQGWLTFVPLAAFLLAGWVGLAILRRRPARWVFGAYLVGFVFLFCWLKKYSFLSDLPFLAFSYTALGMSYIFFRILHLLIDQYEENLPRPPGPVEYLNYTLNFTTLISGPIQRYEDFATQQLVLPQLPLGIVDAGRAFERIVIGFFKVTVAGAVLLQAHAAALDFVLKETPLAMRVAYGIATAAAYTFYLYANFSGYTDIVIGIARFLRFELPENFNRPFSAPNFLDFWSRWHMTLSNWFKTYVYSPLVKALMHRFPSQAMEPFLGVIAFFVTFFLVGLWHGQTSIFIVCGFMLGLGVSMNKLYQVVMVKTLGRKPFRQLGQNRAYVMFSRGLTFTWLNFSLFPFWLNWAGVRAFGNAMGPSGMAMLVVAMILIASLVLGTYEGIREAALSVKAGGAPVVTSRYLRVALATALVVITVAGIMMTAGPPQDIAYKVF